jgi:hypothetical protein
VPVAGPMSLLMTEIEVIEMQHEPPPEKNTAPGPNVANADASWIACVRSRSRLAKQTQSDRDWDAAEYQLKHGDEKERNDDR